MITTDELMEALGKSRQTIGGWTRTGKIPCARRGRGRMTSLYVLEDVKLALHESKPLPPIVENTIEASGEDLPAHGESDISVQNVQKSASEILSKAGVERPKLGRIYLREARAAQKRRERQAERVLLWLAVEAFALESSNA